MPASDGGKEAKSEVRIIDTFSDEDYGDFTLVEVKLHTGRTHQIRVHLTHIGHPLAGDALYGADTNLIPRQALHAYYIEFDHPMTHERLSFEAPIAEDIRNIRFLNI